MPTPVRSRWWAQWAPVTPLEDSTSLSFAPLMMVCPNILAVYCYMSVLFMILSKLVNFQSELEASCLNRNNLGNQSFSNPEFWLTLSGVCEMSKGVIWWLLLQLLKGGRTPYDDFVIHLLVTPVLLFQVYCADDQLAYSVCAWLCQNNIWWELGSV